MNRASSTTNRNGWKRGSHTKQGGRRKNRSRGGKGEIATGRTRREKFRNRRIGYLPKAIEVMRALNKNGFRYPFAAWGVQSSPMESLRVSYPNRK